MSNRGLTSTFSLLYGALFIFVLNATCVSSTLCENRCENAVPYLRRLKEIWHSISKRMGGDDMSFTHFVQSLIVASRKVPSLSPLRQNLVAMVEEYKDCVKACEHQHSKRNGQWNTFPQSKYKPCLSIFSCI